MNNKTGVLDKFVRGPKELLEFAVAQTSAQVALAIADAMCKTNTTPKQLADSIGSYTEEIAEILNADANPSIKTVVRIGRALGCRVVVQFIREDNDD